MPLLTRFLAAAFFSLLTPPLLAAPYFHADTWAASGDTENAAFYEEWYGDPLKHMDEPILSSSTPGTIIRITRHPSFAAPATVRLHLTDKGRPQVTYKKLELDFEGEIVGLTKAQEKWLNRAQCQRVQEFLAQIAPFDPATPAIISTVTSQNGDGNPTEALCIDGTAVVLEVVQNGQYRALSRHD
ncbi:MAG: hypothetical protein ACU0BK_03315 [Shimia sp.]|uniref:hypothetical protein n=1 Tax=Shimia sp. TaxID=1954381 RepID=UPI00405919B6